MARTGYRRAGIATSVGSLTAALDDTFASKSGRSLGLSSVMLAELSAANTIYTHNPAAVYDPVSDSVVVAFLGAERDLYVVEFDNSTGARTGPVKVGDYTLIGAGDDHGTPTIDIDDDGYRHIAWGSHNTNHFYSKSNAARDISAWTTVTLTGEGSYPFLRCRPGTSEVYILDRSGTGHGASFPAHEYAALRKSTDGGATWGAPAAVIDTQDSPEAFSDAYAADVDFDDDGNLRVTWTVARGASHNDTRIDAHHAIYDVDTATWQTLGGTDLGAVITWAEHASCVAYAGSGLSMNLRHLIDADSMLMLIVQSPNYVVAKYSGGAWTSADTGFDTIWENVRADLGRSPRGGYELYFPEDDGDSRSWLAVARSDDGVSWDHQGVVLESPLGEGIERVGAVHNADPAGLVAVAQASLDARDWGTPAAWGKDVSPLYGIVRGAAPSKAVAVPVEGMVKLGEHVCGVDEASISFDLPAGFRHMRVVVSGRTTRAANNDPLRVTLNGAAADYQRQVLIGTGTTASAAEELTPLWLTMGLLPGASAAANHWGISDFTIYDYARAYAFKYLMGIATHTYGTATGEFRLENTSGLWRSTAVVATVTLAPHSTALIAAGTVVTRYGIR